MNAHRGRSGARIGYAMAKLRQDGVPEEQAMAKAYAMEDKGQLREDGTYIPVKKG